jgi:DNA repair protein RecO
VAVIVADDVVVTGLVAFGEADAVVRCFSREHGRIGCFARGARSSKRRFPGLSAPLLGRAQWKPRRSGDLVDLVEVDADTALADLGHDLRAWAFAGYVVELVERFLPEGAPQPEFFDVVKDTLVVLARPGGAKGAVLRAFELQLLGTLGVLPDLTGVVDDPGLPAVAYDAGSGHLLAHATPQSQPFSDAARQAALFLIDDDARGALALPVDDDVLREVAVIFGGWMRRQGVQLRSLDVLRSVRASVDL